MSAPPIMTASPQPAALSQPLSPMQQPMSAPPTVQFSEADFMTNMPILEEAEALQRQQNSENEDFMNILNDLKDFTQNGIQQNDFVNGMEQQQAQPQPGPQPIILSPRQYSPANPVQEQPLSNGPSDPMVNGGSPFPQDMNNPSPMARSPAPGVIRRNPSFSSEQCFTPPVASPVVSDGSLMSPQANHSPLVAWPQAATDMMQNSQAMMQSPMNSEMQSSVNKDAVSNNHMESSHNMGFNGTNSGFNGSGSHPSPSTRALLKTAIRRKSRSCSFDSPIPESFSSPSGEPTATNLVPSFNTPKDQSLYNELQQEPSTPFENPENPSNASFDFEDQSLLSSIPGDETSQPTQFPPNEPSGKSCW